MTQSEFNEEKKKKNNEHKMYIYCSSVNQITQLIHSTDILQLLFIVQRLTRKYKHDLSMSSANCIITQQYLCSFCCARAIYTIQIL